MTAPHHLAGTMSGLYALLDLAGAPLDRQDLATLGLDAPEDASIAATAVDSITPHAVHCLVQDGRTTVFLGYLDEPDELADRFGLARGTPDGVVARTALDRYGAALPAELLGGWMMLDWAPGRPLRLLVGIGGRMPLLYAHVGNRIAIAPSIDRLSRLGWVGRTLDEDAFLLSLTHCTLEDHTRTQTILRGVRSVPRGGCVTITRKRAPHLQTVDPFVAVPPWVGSRDDAMVAAEDMLRTIVRQQLARSTGPGLLLSGGLDSSLIAWAARAEGAPAIPALSSAVAPGRGVTDETAFAAIVADTLGLPLHRVVPPADADLYRPAAGTLATSNAPPLSPRDYLYAAFADVAAAAGVTELFDGVHGELTVTGVMPIWFWRDWPRNVARSARDAWLERGRNRGHDETQPKITPIDRVIDVTLARHRRDQPALRAAFAAEHPARGMRFVGERWGYAASARRPLRRDKSELRAGQLRFLHPFQDIRLLRLFASFPASFMVGEGMSRWPARAILSGHLPDSIARRQTKMPFSPDYTLRLVEQAPRALDRIATFRANGCDAWFDLDWLGEALGRVAAGNARDLEDPFRIQLTAHACEFLTWWRAG